jgi:hypothetical protein
MTVSATTPTITYTYTGPARYDYTYLNYRDTDLVVYHTDLLGITSTLTQDVDYSVVLAGDFQGGYIITTAPVATGGAITLRRELPITQDVDWVNNDPLDADTLERSFDRDIMIIQQLNVLLTEALQANWRGDWAATTEYFVNQNVTAPDSNIYSAVTTHTSGTVFADDLALGRWALVLDLAYLTTLTERCEASEAAAKISEDAALQSENAAASSETQSGLSEANSLATSQESANCAQDSFDSSVLSGTYTDTTIQYAIGQKPLGTPDEPAEGSAKYWAAQASTQAGDKVAQTAIDGSAVIPAGTTAQRDAAPINGYLRLNTDTNTWEGYSDGDWVGFVDPANRQLFFENDIIADRDYTVTVGQNAMSAGPITLDAGVTITVPAGSTYTVV